jgi:hypothetical protein
MAVDVAVEIVARLGRQVARIQVDAERAQLRLGGGGGDCVGREGGNGDGHRQRGGQREAQGR